MLNKLLLCGLQKHTRYIGRRLYHSFPIIESQFDFHSEEAITNRSINEAYYHSTLKIRNAVLDAGKTLPQAAQKLNKLSVYQRISLLQDPDSPILYLSLNAGLNLPYGTVNNGGSVTAITKIMGQYCIVFANDWTFKGGTSYPITVKKQLRAQEIAFQNRLPCIYIVDSGGAFLPLQADIFPDKEHGGRGFRNQAVLSAQGIPQIAVVCGPCTAGGAYIPTMSDEAVIVKGTGSLYLAGPPLVKAATGETIDAEALGGADVHCAISGCTDHFASSEEVAMLTTRRIVESLNMERCVETTRSVPEPPIYLAEDLVSIIPGDEKEWPMMEILARLVDKSAFHPFKEKFGENLICGFARLNGYLVGIIANNGVLDTTSATKGAHFIRLCDMRDIPIIFLQNTPSDDEFLSHTGNSGTIARARGQMMAVVSCSQVPKLTVLLGGSYGPSSYAMCGRAMSPNFLFSWPHARVSVASPEHLMLAMNNIEDESEKNKLLQRLTDDATSFSSHLIDDGVILPQETRDVLSQCLEVCLAYPQITRQRNCPIIRM